MHPNAIQPGDLVEVKVGEEVFEATVLDKQPKVVQISPSNPITYPRRYADYTQVIRIVHRPSNNDKEEAA